MNSTLLKRNEIDSKYKWDIEDIYLNIDDWEKDFVKVKSLMQDVLKYKGILGQDSRNLLDCLTLSDELNSINDKLFVYAKMKRDEDNSNSTYQALTSKAFSINTEVRVATAFIEPEILSIPEDDLNNFINNEKKFFIYRQYLSEILRQKRHILYQKEEEILALVSEIARSPKDVFTMFNNADIKFSYIKDDLGDEIELTKGRYIKFLESKDRRVRKDAFCALYSEYKKQRNSLATMFVSNIKSNKFYKIVRKYNSCLEASLDSDNIDVRVYDNLIETINKNLHLLHRYIDIRKRVLNLDKVHMYDLYVPLADEIKTDIPYQEAKELVEKGLAPLGKEYIECLREGFNSGWIDVYENEGKTSGAYSWGAYNTHPYVLLNYQGTINDVFTLAHEMGHAIHTLHSNKSQPYISAGYKIFVAEVASTVNELILMDYLLKNAENKSKKIYLLNHYLEEFRGTVFRQCMFAEFEKIVHSRIEHGEALTCDILSEIYIGLNAKYFGDQVIIDDQIGMEWARIPHFYNSFYVYKYVTGFSSAVSISKQILNEGKASVDRYIKFLSSGCSDYPLELLKSTGVDLITPKPIQDALDKFESILDELEGLLI